MPDGPSTGAGRALAEVHAPLGGPQWLLCVLVAQAPFLGYSWSRSLTGSDTRLPPGRLSAGVTSSLEGCGVYAGPPWPGKCRLRPGPVISRASGNRACPLHPNRCAENSQYRRLEDSGMFLRARRDWSPQLGLPELPASALSLSQFLCPLQALGSFQPWPGPVAPALFTLLTSPSSLSPGASCFCPLPPRPLVLSVCHRFRVSLNSSLHNGHTRFREVSRSSPGWWRELCLLP